MNRRTILLLKGGELAEYNIKGFVAIDNGSGGYPYDVGDDIFSAKRWKDGESTDRYCKMFGLRKVEVMVIWEEVKSADLTDEQYEEILNETILYRIPKTNVEGGE